MRLTTFTDYCLRTLMYVGANDRRLSTIDEIAHSYGISANHLRKVVHHLGRAGYLRNVRGKGGGICLAREPGDINLGTLIRESEEDTALVECFQATGSECRIQPACTLRGILGEAQQAFYGVLDGYSLSDLLEPRLRLARLMGIETTASAPSD